MISCLRRAGVEVRERHEAVWDGRRDSWKAGAADVGRLALAEARLLLASRERCDAVIVGYPGHFDLPAARHAARGAPVVFNPLVSLSDTFVDDRARFRPGTPAARALAAVDRHALRAADLVVADTRAHAEHLAEIAGLDPNRVAVCFVGAEERLFRPGWAPQEPFACLFVGKLIPLHGLETILAAARLAPELRFRIVGSGQLDGLLAGRPANVEHVPWVEYERLPGELHRAQLRARHLRHVRQGRPRDPEQGLPGARLRHAARHRRHTGRPRAARRRRERSARPPRQRRGARAGAAQARRRPRARAQALSAGGLAAYREHASEDVLGARWRRLLEELA